MDYETSLKIIAFIIAIYLLYYFIYKFDFDLLMKDLLRNYPTKEHFSIIFKPNKLYRIGSQIYLLDTNNIMVKNKNPIIFNTFEEYQQYMINLEDEVQNNFSNIRKDSEIPTYYHDLEYRNKRNNPDFRNFDYINNCKKKVVFCNNDKGDIPFGDKIFNEETEKCKDEVCNINLFDKEQCTKIKNYNDKELFIKTMCEDNTPKPSDVSKECKSFKKYTRLGNRRLYDEFCIEKNNLTMDKCLLGEYFKDNLLEFEL